MGQALTERGIATFRYNFPYKEAGGGPPNPKPVLTATVRAAAETAAKAAPDLALFAGGRSMGGRMSSLAASEAPLPKVKGLIFFAFPLHPADKPGTSRAEHLSKVEIPMLFIQGPKDKLATPALLGPVIKGLGTRATLHTIEGADHSFRVPKSSGRSEQDVMGELADVAAKWIVSNSG